MDKQREELKWTAEEENQLLCAMAGYRPVGINRHLAMACILERLQATMHRELSFETVWDKLRTMYDLDKLSEEESLRMASLFRKQNFELPASWLDKTTETKVKRAIKRRRTDSLKKSTQSNAVDGLTTAHIVGDNDVTGECSYK